MKKWMVIFLIVFLSGCGSYQRFVRRADDRVADEFRRYPCVDPQGRCTDKIDDWIMKW
jgi:hypothetical protein